MLMQSYKIACVNIMWLIQDALNTVVTNYWGACTRIYLNRQTNLKSNIILFIRQVKKYFFWNWTVTKNWLVVVESSTINNSKSSTGVPSVPVALATSSRVGSSNGSSTAGWSSAAGGGGAAKSRVVHQYINNLSSLNQRSSGK